MGKYEELFELVKKEDADGIEDARDRVKPEDLGDLIEMYWQLETWDEKSCLMQLFSDNLVPQGREVMLDFLKAPVEDLVDEYTLSGKVVAVLQLDGNLGNYDAYWDDRALLTKRLELYSGGRVPGSSKSQASAAELRKDYMSQIGRGKKKWWQFWK